VVEDVRRALMEGRCSVPAVGSVIAGQVSDLPFVVVDGNGRAVEPVSVYLRDLMLGDASPLTCRSYVFDLLRWHRLLWFVQRPWEKATEAEVAVLVGRLREARNPQRRRRETGSATRMAGDERLTLAEVQTILRHAHLDTTGRYLTARIEDMHDKLTEHYSRPRPQPTYAVGYDPDDIKAVFGG
jgi:hypothetical protein